MNFRGLVAAILAGGLSLALILGIGGAVWQRRPLGENGAEVLTGVFVAMAAAIAAYMATKNGP